MGYLTNFILTVKFIGGGSDEKTSEKFSETEVPLTGASEVPKETLDSIVEELSKLFLGNGSIDCEENCSCYMCIKMSKITAESLFTISEQMKWYDYIENMESLSEKFPSLIFTLRGEGEDREDVWTAEFSNGRYKFFHEEEWEKYMKEKLKDQIEELRETYKESLKWKRVGNTTIKNE